MENERKRPAESEWTDEAGQKETKRPAVGVKVEVKNEEVDNPSSDALKRKPSESSVTCQQSANSQQPTMAVATSSSENLRTKVKLERAVVRSAGTVGMPKVAAKKPTKQNAEVIIIDDSSSDEGDSKLSGDNEAVISISSSNNTSGKTPPTENWDHVDIGPPNIVGTLAPYVFPYNIDTGFNGNAKKQKYPNASMLKEISSVEDSTTCKYSLPLIWPQTTPTPVIGGGFFEEFAPKNRKVKKKTQTYSRIARLAGTIDFNVKIHNLNVAKLICYHTKIGNADLTNTRRKFVIAEDLLSLQKKIRKPFMSKQSKEILTVISELNDRKNPFEERCLYALAEGPAVLSLEESVGSVATLKFHIYFRRALFGLSAHPHIKTLLNVLTAIPTSNPSHRWHPCRQVPKSTKAYQHSEYPQLQDNAASKSKFEHSLPGILWANENMGYPMSRVGKNDYTGVKVQLRDYQLESVTWMRHQENLKTLETGGGVAGLNGYFWERRTLADGEPYYYFPLGGHVLLHSPPVVSGGMLAEEMGLGKTVITLELVCSERKSFGRGGTLIVLPVSLLVQWKDEICSKAPHLKYLIYHGDIVKEFHEKFRTYAQRIYELSKYDVVLTTMGKLTELTSNRMRGVGYNSLGKVPWHRLVVDECQFLKNDTTAIARAAAVIDAKHIWMLTGTPLTNKLDDLRGELSLLRVWPFTLGTSSDENWQDHFWSEMKSNWDAKNDKSLPVIKQLMDAVSMRHSRLQTRSDGSPLVHLPPRTEGYMAVTMDSNSSSAFVNYWVEALATKYLQTLGRFDVRVAGLILKLQQLASIPGPLIQDIEQLQQIDDKLSDLKKLIPQNTVNGMREVDLRTAIIEKKQENDSAILSELVLLAKRGASCLTPCNYCKIVQTKPSYTKCGHSLCAGCCQMLLRKSGDFSCPVCKETVKPSDIMVVRLPEDLTSDIKRASQTNTHTTRNKIAIDVDIDEIDFDQILADPRLLQQGCDTNDKPQDDVSMTMDSHQGINRTYSVTYEQDGKSFQEPRNASKHTLESLKGFPRPDLSLESQRLERHITSFLANKTEMKDLVCHAIACNFETSPKIKALCDTIQTIRESSLEAKICIFSSFSRVLDEVEVAIDNVRYSVEYNMDTNINLVPGQAVKIKKTSEKALVQADVSTDRANRQNATYLVQRTDGSVIAARRNEIEVLPVLIDNVPSRMIRKNSHTKKLSVNGSDDRHSISAQVMSKRPPVSSDKLQVSYQVEILPEEATNDGNQSGTVTFVHRRDTSVSYNILPDGYERVPAQPGLDPTYRRKSVLYNLPSSRLKDKGGNTWLPAQIKKISTKTKLKDTHFEPNNNDREPFKNALGYVRVDGKAGSASIRGEIFDTFKRDPMTSICLLTKRAAGVGINLTDANHVIILEPSMDAHDELQSICRVHRIGQTRNVSIRKFYICGSVEERILKRRQQRGDLNLSINSVTGRSDSGEHGGKEERNQDSEIMSSRVMTYADHQLLLDVSDTSSRW